MIYLKFPKIHLWIIDGGIELKFRNTTFSLAWNPDKASFIFENKKNATNLYVEVRLHLSLNYKNI
ncbi:hypothetical protein [Winogradskyella sp. SM1960]|uniref:hypothetical protein n=1 Tax=Winogradskyella sp. SM1960 TaxID=2865955 RepID=UPI001CD6A5D1|nr:hypothetical protein [Winogradskyella sp. SM1960]